MGKPAARMGDMTAHGGAIMVGFPMVLIGGMPAARMGDMHVCPMVTPALPPIPHVGGPVILGSPMVLIGGMPAARMGDMLVCVGPPDSIVMGCPTVLIGEGGSGSASGGGGMGALGASMARAASQGGGMGALGKSIAEAATSKGTADAAMSGLGALLAGATMAQSGSKESSTQAGHWVEFAFVDKAGNPVSNVPYEFTGPDGKKTVSVLQSDGKVRRDGLKQGQCKVRLFNVLNARWSKTSARAGEKVKLSAEAEGFRDNEEGAFYIFRRDISRADEKIAELPSKVRTNRLEAEWEYPATSEEKQDKPSSQAIHHFSAPEYYFDVTVGPCKARSSFLTLEDTIEITVKDEKGKPRANEEYVLYLSNGSVRKGRLDGQGHKKEEKVPAGRYDIEFPNLPRGAEKK